MAMAGHFLGGYTRVNEEKKSNAGEKKPLKYTIPRDYPIQVSATAFEIASQRWEKP